MGNDAWGPFGSRLHNFQYVCGLETIQGPSAGRACQIHTDDLCGPRRSFHS